MSDARIIRTNQLRNFSVMISLKFLKMFPLPIVFAQNVNTIMKKNINSTHTVIREQKKIKENFNNV